MASFMYTTFQLLNVLIWDSIYRIPADLRNLLGAFFNLVKAALPVVSRLMIVFLFPIYGIGIAAATMNEHGFLESLTLGQKRLMFCVVVILVAAQWALALTVMSGLGLLPEG